MWKPIVKAPQLLPLAGAFIALFAGLSAFAEPVLMINQLGDEPKAEKVELEVRPSQKVNLVAGYYDAEGKPVAPGEEPEGTYEWKAECGRSPCADAKFEEIEHGRTFTVPAGDFRAIRVVVTHAADSATFVLKNAEKSEKPGEPAEPAPEESKKPRAHNRRPPGTPEPAAPADGTPSAPRTGGRGGHHGGRNRGSDTSTSSGGGGVLSSAGGGSSSFTDHSSSSRGKRNSRGGADAAYDHYYSDMPYSGGWSGGSGGGSSATTARGYNRDNEVPVIGCSHEVGADGFLHLVCEDSARKVLRVGPKAKAAPKKPAPKPASKPTPKAPAKKPVAKKSASAPKAAPAAVAKSPRTKAARSGFVASNSRK